MSGPISTSAPDSTGLTDALPLTFSLSAPSRADFIRVLHDKFSLDNFREGQQAVIDVILSRQDVFVTWPTGSGKSLLYQLPSILDSGTTVVISPLIALMREQVASMNAKGIDTALITANTSTKERQAILRQASGLTPLNLLYLTPEFVMLSPWTTDFFTALQSNAGLTRFIIDEAHCVSHWGRSFRPSYFDLGILRQMYPTIPIVCLGATASESCRKDVLDILGLKIEKVQLFSASFNRPNLHLEVSKKCNEEEKVVDIIRRIKEDHSEQSGIIYCLSRALTEKVAGKLITAGISAMPYHAGMIAEDREAIQDEWLRGDIKIIIATTAFGMGINKPEVRFVFHFSIPRNLEDYHQQIGRAGRDGQVASCVLYYSSHAMAWLKSIMDPKEPAPPSSTSTQREDPDEELRAILNQESFVHNTSGNLASMSASLRGGSQSHLPRIKDPKSALNSLLKVQDFCLNYSVCRRQLLLSHFGEELNSEDCHKTCDSCLRGFEEEDCTKLASLALFLIQDSVRRGGQNRITLVQGADLLLGSKKRDLRKKGLERSRGFDVARGMHQESARMIFSKLMMEGVIEEVQTEIIAGRYAFYLFIKSQERAQLVHSRELKIMLSPHDIYTSLWYVKEPWSADGDWRARQLPRPDVVAVTSSAEPTQSTSSPPTSGLLTSTSSSETAPSSNNQPQATVDETAISSTIEAAGLAASQSSTTTPTTATTTLTTSPIPAPDTTDNFDFDFDDDNIYWDEESEAALRAAEAQQSLSVAGPSTSHPTSNQPRPGILTTIDLNNRPSNLATDQGGSSTAALTDSSPPSSSRPNKRQRN